MALFQLMYGIDGRRDLEELEDLLHLDGHRGSRPVRIGNGCRPISNCKWICMVP